ncbi:MAG: hypothetical protein WC683_09415 [bacterium]|jgi:GNAT superfamily N-acetyltransferase
MIIRPAAPDDLAWIYSTWLGTATSDGYLEHTTDRRVRECPRAEFFPRWRALAGRLLSRSRVAIATHEADPTVICGWLCWTPGSPPWVHYVHVRRRMRRHGVARALLEAAKIDRSARALYSHRTDYSDAIVPDAWSYRPWLLIGV